MDTLDKVRDGTMRVGVVVHAPWIRLEEGQPSGVEVELIEDFAKQLGSEVEYVEGTVPELLEAIKQGEVDVLIGGLSATDPGVREQKEAGITNPYLTTRFVVGVPPNEETFDDLSGRKVAIERIDATAALLKEEGAIPVRVDDLCAARVPVAAYPWQLAAWGFESTGLELPEEEHVFAAPPGENGWLVRLERFLQAHREEAKTLLREESTR
jgi:polar amino acid transport system substrate-binding protein